jgi:hypothetical protein
MRKLVFVLITLVFTLSLGAAQASADVGKDFSYFFHFQWLRDADGDGIPNCLDDDWERPQNGTGNGIKNGGCLPTDGLQVVTDGEGAMTKNQKKYRNKGGSSDGQHDRDRDRDRSCQ